MRINPFKRISVSIKEMISEFKNGSKRDKGKFFLNLFYLAIGSIILSFGTSIFLISDGIPAGGLSGLGVVIGYLVSGFNIEIFVLVATWSLFFVGWIFLGTRFIFKTLISTIIFPLALLAFSNIPFFVEMANNLRASEIVVSSISGDEIHLFDNVQILLNGLFGGALVGVGVSLTFIGGGSSGGVDVLYFILAKYLRIRQSISSFAIDAVILLAGIVIKAVMSDAEIIRPLIGIVSVLVSSIMIEYFYIRKSSAYVVEIISTRWEEINSYIQDEIGRGTTIFPIKGGYNQEDKILLRAVFDQTDYQSIRSKISQVDPNAFVTYTRTEAVFGEGFTPHRNVLPSDNNETGNVANNG